MGLTGEQSITEVIGTVTRSLIPVNTESEIYQQVCKQFAASESYSSAWIDRYNPENEAGIPSSAAGITKKALDEITATTDSPPQGLADEAVEQREVISKQNLLDDPPCEEWYDHAENHGYQSYAVIPLVYEKSLYGVLHLTTVRVQGFGAAEQESLAELGRTIAYACKNAEASADMGSTESESRGVNTELTSVSAEPVQERRLYETIISSTPDLIYAFDLDYRFIFANDALLEMWGQTLEESVGKTLEEVGYEPWHAEMHEREIDRVVETKEPIRGDVGFEHAELGPRIYDYIFAPVLNDEGEVEAIAGTTRDVTERKEAEEALEKSKERFRALVTASSDVVYRMSPGWDKMQQLEGQGFLADTNEPTNDWVDKYILPADQERVMEAINDAIQTKSTFEMEHRVEQADGTVGWTFSRAVPMQDDDGDIVEWIGMATDITEQKERERELERALDLLEKTERIADVGGWEIDVETQEVFWTDHIFELLEIDTGEEPPLEEALAMYHEDDRPIVEEAIENALNSGDPFEREARIRTNSGEVRWLRLQGIPETVDGEVVTLRGAAQDVTERREREQRLEEVVERLEESNKRLEQFAYAASHDLQEPLRMVSTYLQLIEARYADALEQDGREFLEFAVDGADRMRAMIEGLLQYSRVDTAGKPLEPVDLDSVFADVKQDLRVKIEEHDADITAEGLPRVMGDAGQLRQLFQNLLDNAIDYSGDDPPRVHVSAEQANSGDEWMISVSDEGIGIDSEHVDRVFEVFESLHSQDEHDGTGIGLALCERIIERHGGDIWVESEPGEGSTFSFTLPAVSSP